MQREFKKNLKYIAKKRRESQAEIAAKRDTRLRDKITKTLALDGDARTLPERMTLPSFAEFRLQARSKAAIVREVKLNINCLKAFYGHKHKDLIAYSSAGVMSLTHPVTHMHMNCMMYSHVTMSRHTNIRNKVFARQYYWTIRNPAGKDRE